MDSKSDDKKPKRVKLIRTVLSKKSDGSVQSSPANDLQAPKKILPVTKTDDNRVNEKNQSDNVCSNSAADKNVITNVDNNINQSTKSSENIIKTSTVVVSQPAESKPTSEDILKGNLVQQKAEQKEQPKQLLDVSVKPNVTAKRPKLIRPTFSNKNQSTVEKSNLNLPKSGSNSPVYGSKESIVSPRSCRESDNDCKEKVISLRQTEIDNEYNEKSLNNTDTAIKTEGNGKQCDSEHDVKLKEHMVHQSNESENENKEDKVSSVNYELKEEERLLIPAVCVDLNKISPSSPVFDEPKEEQIILAVNEELKEENTISPVRDELKEGKLISHVNNELREEKPALPINDELREEKPASPVNDEVREEKSASLVNDELKEESIILAMCDKSKEEKLLSPINDESKEENLASLVSDNPREENPASPVSNEVEEKLASPVNELKEQKPASPVSDKTEEKPASPGSDEPREEKSLSPISDELRDKESPSCVNDELKEENTVSSLYNESKEDKLSPINDELKNGNPGSAVSDEIEENPVLAINDELKEENRALPTNEPREENLASPVSDKVNENPVSPVKDEVEENPMSPVKDEIEENPVSPVKDEIEENPVSPVKDEIEEKPVSPARNEVEEKPTSPAKDEVEEKPTSPAKDEVEEKPASPVKDEIEEKPVSPARNEAEEKPASPAKDEEETPASPAKDEEETPASPAKDEEETPASPAKDEVVENPASLISDEVVENPASLISDEVVENPASLISDEVVENPASLISDEVVENPASLISDEVVENPASLISDEVKESPVSSVTDGLEEKPPSPVNELKEQKPAPSVNDEAQKPASPVSDELKEETLISPMCNDQKEEKLLSPITDDLKEGYLELPVRSEVEGKTALVTNDELKDENVILEENEIDNELKEEKNTPVALKIGDELKEDKAVPSAHSNGDDNEVRKEDNLSPMLSNKTGNEIKEKEIVLLNEMNDEQKKIATSSDYKIKNELNEEKAVPPIIGINKIDIELNRDTKESEQCDKIENELKEERTLHEETNDLNEKKVMAQNNDTLEENVPSVASIIEGDKHSIEGSSSVDIIILEKTETKDTNLPDESCEITAPTERLHSSNHSDGNSHLPMIVAAPDVEHIETGLNTVDEPLIDENTEAEQNSDDKKFCISTEMEIREETEEVVKQLNIATMSQVNNKEHVELTVNDGVKVNLLQSIESKVEHISEPSECSSSSSAVIDRVIGEEKEKNDDIADVNACSDDDGAKVEKEEINDFNEDEIKQPADQLYEEKLPEEKPVKNTFQAIRKSDTVIIVKKSEVNADEIKSYVKSSKFKSKMTKTTESSKLRESIVTSVAENKGDIGKNVTVCDSREVDDAVKTDRVEVCNTSPVPAVHDAGVQENAEYVDKCADIEKRQVTDTCDLGDDRNIDEAPNTDPAFHRACSADKSERNSVQDEKIDEQSCVSNNAKLSTVSDNQDDKSYEKLPSKPSDEPVSPTGSSFKSADAPVEENVLPLSAGNSKTDNLCAIASCTPANEISPLDETNKENGSAVKISKRIDDTPVERDLDSAAVRVEKSESEIKSVVGVSEEKENVDANHQTTIAATENVIKVVAADSSEKRDDGNNVDSTDSTNGTQYRETRVDETVALTAVTGSEQTIAIDPGIIVMPDGTIRKKRGRKKKCLVAAQANNVIAVSVPKPESQPDKPLRTSSRIASRSSLKAGAEKSTETTNVSRSSVTENDVVKDGNNKAESSLNEEKSPLKKRRKKMDIVDGIESSADDLKEEVTVGKPKEDGSVIGESQPKKRRKKIDADGGKVGVAKEEADDKQKEENDAVTVDAEPAPKKRKKRIDVAEEAVDHREESVGSDQEPIERVKLSLNKKSSKKIPALIPVKQQQQVCTINVDEPLAEIRVHLGSIPSVTSVAGDKSKIPRTIKRTISTRLNKVKEENGSKRSRTRTLVEGNGATETGISATDDVSHQTTSEPDAPSSCPEDAAETTVNTVDDDVAIGDKLADAISDVCNETDKQADTVDNVYLSNSANTTDDIINICNVDRAESSAKDNVDEKIISHVEDIRSNAKSSSSSTDNGASAPPGNTIVAEKEKSLKLHLSVQGDCVSIKTAKKEQPPSEISNTRDNSNSSVTRDNVSDNAANGKVEEKKQVRNKGETLAPSALDYSLPHARPPATNAPTAGISSKSSGTKRKEKSHDSSDRVHPLILHVKSDEKTANFDSLKSPNKRYILDGLKIKKLPADVVSGSTSRYSDQQQALQHQLSQNQPWSTPEMLRVERLLKESNVTITPILQSEPELAALNGKSTSATSATSSSSPAALFPPKSICTTAQSPMFSSSPTAPMFTSSPTSPMKWDAISQFQSLYSLPFCSKDSISSKFINKSSIPTTAPIVPSTIPANPSAFKPQPVLPPLPPPAHGSPGLGRHFIGNSSGSETANTTDVQIVPLPSSTPVKSSVDVKSEIRKKIAISEQRKQKQSAGIDNSAASGGGNNSGSAGAGASETVTPDVKTSNVAMAAVNMSSDQQQPPISLPQFFDGNIPPVFPPTATTYITARGKIRIRGTGRRGRPPKTLVNARNEQLMKEYLNMSRDSIPPALASFVASTQSFMESNFKRFASSQAVSTTESSNNTEAYTGTNAKVASSDAVPEEQHQPHGHFMFPIPLFDISEQSFEQTPENEYNQFVKAERSTLEQPPVTPVKGKRGRKRKIDVTEPEPDPVDPVLEMEEITRLEEERVKKELEKERKMEMRKQRLKERNELAKQKRLRQKQKAEERQKRLKEKKLKLQEEKKKLEEEIRNLPPTLCSFDDETRMSADNGQSSQPAAPSVNVVEGVEEDECSGATTESQKTKKRVELSELESKDMTVDQIAEYQWPIQGGELYMIQEQISHYLGVKSFKRKYPDIKRRPVDSEERAYLVDSGLVSESLCDLGITAVPTSEVLDIMCTDFPDKYEELRKHMREKQAKELSFKQKAWANGLGYKLLMADGTKQDLKKRAMESASNWNVALNKSRKEDRRCVIDLQTYIVHYPRVKTQKVADQSPKIGSYPVSILPGQYCDHYKPYTPDELRYLPVNTVLYGPIKQLGIKSANDGSNVEDDAISVSSSSSSCSSCSSSSSSSPSDDEHEVQSVTENIESIVNDDTRGAINDCNISGISDLKMETDADQNEMTDCAVGDHEYAMSGFGNRFNHHEEDEDLSNDAKLTCRVCHDDEACSKEGLLEELIHCSQCHSVYHAGCLELSTEMIPHVKKYNWLCTDCKVCVRCLDQSDEDKMLFCDLCDRGYHIYCVGMKRVPNGRWHCSECAVCDMCGTTEPGIAEDALWFYEYKKLNNGKNQYVRCLCLPCARKVQDMIGPPPAQRQQLSAQQMPYSKIPSLPLSSTGS